MTTIAFDGRCLATDSRASRNGVVLDDQAEKLWMMGEGVVAAVGHGNLARAWAHWVHDNWAEWASGARASVGVPPQNLSPEALADCALIVWTAGQLWEVCGAVPIPTAYRAPATWGTGAELALGALEAGVNAMQAVEIACRRDRNSGGPVRFVDTQDLGAGVQTWNGGDELTSKDENCPKCMPAGAIFAAYLDTVMTGTGAVRMTHVPVTEMQEIGDGVALNSIAHPGSETYAICIHKPRSSGEPDFKWSENCAGRLIDGSGCGRCLRCNREWWALQRDHLVGGADTMMLTKAQVDATLAKHPVAPAPAVPDPVENPVTRPPGNWIAPGHALDCMINLTTGHCSCSGLRILPPAAPDPLRIALNAWVMKYNNAVAAGELHKCLGFEQELRSMHFPPGVKLEERFDTGYSRWLKVIVDEKAPKSSA